MDETPRKAGSAPVPMGNLRRMLSANAKKKPKKQRKRRRKVAKRPAGSGAPKMPPGLRY